MEVLNNSTNVVRLPDGKGNYIELCAGRMENTENGTVLRPGVNDIPEALINLVKKCLGPVRWSNHARKIIVKGDKIIPPIPVKNPEKLTAAEIIDIVKNSEDDKELISLINQENLRDEPRKTVVEAIEKRMNSLVKSREKEKADGEHKPE
jgi:hypothetical protein